MDYVQEIDGCMERTIGKSGISNHEFLAELEECGKALSGLRQSFERREIAALDTGKSLKKLEQLFPLTEDIRKNFETVLILGVGGSSLGGNTLSALLGPGVVRTGNPQVYFLDNIDPHTMKHTLGVMDLEKTFFVVISKSGKTLSTLAQFLICSRAVSSAFGQCAVQKHFIVVSEATDNPLRACAERMSILVLEHDSDIGGRFSVFSTAGLTPALIAGVNCKEVLEGSASVLHKILSDAPMDVIEPVKGAAVVAGLAKKRNVTASVLMPYSDRLQCFSFWYRQLVAESLGKNGMGILPINALGTVDQHSQLQLFLDGPRDKMITFIGTNTAGLGEFIPTKFVESSEAELFKDRVLGDLFEAEYEATAQSLINAGCPIRKFHVESLSEKSLGALLAHFMIEVILLGDRFGLNPFDQPAVQEGKALTRRLLLNDR